MIAMAGAAETATVPMVDLKTTACPQFPSEFESDGRHSRRKDGKGHNLSVTVDLADGAVVTVVLPALVLGIKLVTAPRLFQQASKVPLAVLLKLFLIRINGFQQISNPYPYR